MCRRASVTSGLAVLMPLLIVTPRYLSVISAFTGIKSLSAPSVLLVQSPAVGGQFGARSPEGPPILTDLETLRIFFPVTSEESEEWQQVSPPRLGVPFRLVHSNYSWC